MIQYPVFCQISSKCPQTVFFFFFFLLRVAPAAYEISWAKGLIGGAASAGLNYSHSNTGSKPHLRPTLQLAAMLDL